MTKIVTEALVTSRGLFGEQVQQVRPIVSMNHVADIARSIAISMASSQGLISDPRPDSTDNLLTQERPSAAGVAKYACDVAESLWVEYQQREWLLSIPQQFDAKAEPGSVVRESDAESAENVAEFSTSDIAELIPRGGHVVMQGANGESVLVGELISSRPVKEAIDNG